MPVQQLAELIRFVRRNSPFYQELYAHLPERVESLEDLPVVPQTEFWRANSPRDNRLLTAPLDEAVVFRSGGTTGSPKFSVYTRTEWEEFTTAFGAGLVTAGLRPGHRVADLFYAGDLYASFMFILDSLHRSPVANVRLPVGGATSWESTAATLEEFRAQVIAGTPTTLCALADRLVAAGRPLPDVELLFFGGECVFGDQLPLLKQAFPAAEVRSIGYASVDAGLLGEAVPGEDPRVHRVFAPHTVVEILADDADTPVTAEGVPGRLVVTDLRRRLMPVLRYPAGDRAEWVDRAAGLFRILGRAEEGVRLGPVTLYTQDVHDIVAATDDAGRITGVQLVVRRQDGRDELLLRLAADELAGEDDKVAEAITTALLTGRPAYDSAVSAGHVNAPVVEWVRHRDLAVNARSGKLIRVVDERPHS
ncbi:phenylacetate--CoA ligase family protein [Streptantibioticus cattleyicolor]|uniref:AMP-dependent synthetase/ligase n=1 Tax=Streptantibioticus cattleyicolor (strain ATCC 35852 / DSM 46488 / JCM 4925 / NBRC 14057 / NRRL 8057) TaxID=1003195 RepID=F8JK76_STREN|nr:phenylacetate--CoA ligase family protein [Streptantibioticus cattleyicolor]AEW98562.1 AMP-dependent synthetase/ligase [Streptantibioticus cattleyicolor NRRL 8057 = DSM 46488]CCB72379.1 AMP-dependent synthetase/ligase [Streptantibioticus cattleyicolor NRRL 8057 = DSM 46488]